MADSVIQNVVKDLFSLFIQKRRFFDKLRMTVTPVCHSEFVIRHHS